MTHDPGVAARARQRRHELFKRLLDRMPSPISLLDVGGTLAYWQAVGLPSRDNVQIMLLNMEGEPVRPPFTSVSGDARDLSRYADRSIDVVFSNSVIGHVGSFADQQRMAREIRRVGRRYFVQTPNHGFPIDWRTMVPFFHLLPAPGQAWLFERMRVGTYRRATDREEALHWASRIRNVRRHELSVLFPDGQVVEEKMGCLTKSFIVHNFSQS
jgi:Methyltransferase domain